MMATGRIFPVISNKEVVLISGGLSSIVQLRYKGNPTYPYTFYTVRETIETK